MGYAVILAGGLGRRLRPLTSDRPKPMVEVAGKPIVEWQIMWLKKYGIRTFIVLTGYLKEKIIDYLGSGSRLGVNITYVVEDVPLGTGGAIKNAEGILKKIDRFIVINGDIITNIDVNILLNSLTDRYLASIALVPLKSPYGIVKVDEEGNVRSFLEKPLIKDYLINAGVYVMRPGILDYLPVKGDIEKTTFPTLASKGLLKGVVFENVYWRSIDTLKDLEEVSKDIEDGVVKF